MDPRQIAIDKQRRTISIRSSSDETCAICLDSMRDKCVTNLQCGHSLHLTCFKTMKTSLLTSKHKCPVCRSAYTAGEDTQSLVGLINVVRSALDDGVGLDVLSHPALEAILNRDGAELTAWYDIQRF